jgi:glycosyltransferase involved in cell wall biosynthesis
MRRRPPIVTTIHNVSRPRDYPIGARLLNRLSELTIFESRFERDQLVSRGLDPSRAVVIHNGIDLERFRPRPRDRALMERFCISETTPVAGVVARFSPEKSLDVLLRAWALTLNQAPGVRLLLVGDGPLRAKLETLAHDLGISGSIIFAGVQKDVPAYLSLCDCFVLTSSRESFPLAAREAMGMALPVIAPRVGGCPEVVDDGWTGLLARPGDAPAFAGALSSLLANRPRAQALGRAARAKAEREYTNGVWVDANERVFLQMVAGVEPRTVAAEGIRLAPAPGGATE